MIFLNQPQYVQLYTDLANKMLENSFFGEVCEIKETKENGDIGYTEGAQYHFNEYCNIVEKTLAENGIKVNEAEQ